MGYRNEDVKPCGLFSCCICTIGLIILVTGAIGYPIAQHDNEIFDETICNITNHRVLDTKKCYWTEHYCNGYSCGSKGTSCCESHYTIPYTCFRPIWNVKYKSLDGDNCDKTIKSKIKGGWEHSSGPNAIENSREAAQKKLRERPVGLLWICYYNHNKCDEVKWDTHNETAWYKTLIAGAYITGIGLIFLLMFACEYYGICWELECENMMARKRPPRAEECDIQIVELSIDDITNIPDETNTPSKID